MLGLEIFLWILLILLVFGILPTMVLSYVIFSVLLVRNKPEKWDHGCSQPDDPEIVAIHSQGEAWREAYAAHRQSVYIHNDGLKLYGEFYDFGSPRTVVVIPGRMESCVYACFFAEAHRLAGCNVFVMDGRAHGFSEGRYNTVGYRESGDLLAWGRWLRENTCTQQIVVHGICIGACTALFALTDPACPDTFVGMAAEGMYSTFYSSFKNHMKFNKRPLFPFLYEVMVYIRLILGINVVTDGPIKRIGKLRKPILFIHGHQDAFSLPAQAQQLYDACQAPKELVWFEKGTHSRLRINNTEAYDRAMNRFLASLD